MKLVDGKVLIELPIDPDTDYYRFAVPIPEGMEGEALIKAHFDKLAEAGQLLDGAVEVLTPVGIFADWEFVED